MAITFDSIGNGRLHEEFNMALRQIGRNILDPNMDETAAREMIISIKFKPSGPGKMNVTYNVKSKLAGFRKSETMFLIGQDSSTGRIDMSEPGSGFQQVSPAREIPAAAYEEVSPGRKVDPETGEIFEERRTGPIDLRRQQA